MKSGGYLAAKKDKSHLGKGSELSIASPVSVICPLESSHYFFCIMFDEQLCQPINLTLFTLFQLCIPLLCTVSSSTLKTVMLLKKSSKKEASRRHDWEYKVAFCWIYSGHCLQSESSVIFSALTLVKAKF